MTVKVSAGQVHDSTQMESVMEQVAIPQPLGRPRRRPRRLAGDKGYSMRHIRQWLRRHRIMPVIPHKENELARLDGRVKFDKQAYKRQMHHRADYRLAQGMPTHRHSL